LPQQASEDTLITDKPENALSSSFELVEGDFIVLATDGLWDNLSEGLLLLKLAKIKV
jgi:serine/threonine protein phosphatase PrpC